jgi:hypothetical protein
MYFLASTNLAHFGATILPSAAGMTDRMRREMHAKG